MSSWFSKAEILCKLPLHEIQENSCNKTHPKIDIAEEISNSPRACHVVSNRNICESKFSNNTTKFLKRFSQRCYSKLVLLPWLKFLRRLYENLRRRFLPLKELAALPIADYVETRNWSTGSICCMNWHPHLFKLAIAGTDDVVRVYTDKGITRPLLKHKSQKSITCMAWRPCAMEDLAVGCAKGIVFWFADTPKTELIYPKLLIHGDHYPVTSLAWNIDGLLLASCSPHDSSVLLWNVFNGECTPLRRFGPQCTLLRWAAPTGQLFCATVNTTFRIWKLREFCDVDRWNLNCGRITSACWSPCGKILLFINSDQELLFCLKQITKSPFLNVSKEWEAFPIADLSVVDAGDRLIGGLPQCVVWDMRGIFVGVTFRESNCVAIFYTKIEGEKLSVVPYGFVAGNDVEFPQCLCFQSYNLFSQNVILTIGWSSGRIEFCLLGGA